MSTLDSKLRKKLEDVVVEARDVAEAGARDALQALTVHEGKRGSHLSESQIELRNRLRIHGRQLGDERRDNGDQAIDQLVEECAYEHWHRMLFSRFLAANELLVEPQSGMAVSLEDVAELALEETFDPWELAASFATGMLPQIFRVDSPVLALSLPIEKRKKLEELLESLPSDVFVASDSLGWVYQFWQTKRNAEVNASGEPVGSRELPAATQFFTEPYMVSFLLDNTLGAWWATQRLTNEDFRTAISEQELRDKASLPGMPLDYLRFTRTRSGFEAESENYIGPWTPVGGPFGAWPNSLSEFKTLDPCCGSGHFLVATFLMLVPMRMVLEELSAPEAVDRVLSENLHGLEIDQRCVELAAFALAMASWKYPNAGGYRKLPELNVACCGLSVSVSKDEWKDLAADNENLRVALAWLHDEFKHSPSLGSLVNPSRDLMNGLADWPMLSTSLEKLLISPDDSSQQTESAVVAFGLAKAAAILGSSFDLLITNVPFLGSGKQEPILAKHLDDYYELGKADLSTAFLLRCQEFVRGGGIASIVSPQNWLFLGTYKKLRESLLNRQTWRIVARLGTNAFRDMNWWAATTSLTVISSELPDNESKFCGLDVGAVKDQSEKADMLRGHIPCELHFAAQEAQLENPGSRIVFEPLKKDGVRLDSQVTATQGISPGDTSRMRIHYWEIPKLGQIWKPLQSTPTGTKHFDGLSYALYDPNSPRCEELSGFRLCGDRAWGKLGCTVGKMATMPASLYMGGVFDANAPVLSLNGTDLAAVWCFVRSDSYSTSVRMLDQKSDAAVNVFDKVSFDLTHWQEVAAEKYPHGLPEPYTDDPTQWIFHGHPASSTDALQVAVARLLGYRWPAELNAEMKLATDSCAWSYCCGQLNSLADDDGIVCIPAVASEQPAHERLLSLLHQVFEDGLAQERVFREKIEGADENDPLTLDLLRREWKPSLPNDFSAWFNRLLDVDGHKGNSLGSWLRDRFFESHCKRFSCTPFIWQIWDGHREGFSALVNYHKLAGSNGRRLLEKLTHSYLGDWINRQQDDVKRGIEGADARLIAARNLKAQLELILAGEPPYDIFVRWKPLHEQPIGWEPDINDGVRLNIRPFMAVDNPGGKKGAGILRVKPNTIKWTKDRGKEVEKPIEDFPWFWDWDGKTQDFTGGKKFTGDRWNDLHYSNAFKQKARETAKNREVQA